MHSASGPPDPFLPSLTTGMIQVFTSLPQPQRKISPGTRTPSQCQASPPLPSPSTLSSPSHAALRGRPQPRLHTCSPGSSANSESVSSHPTVRSLFRRNLQTKGCRRASLFHSSGQDDGTGWSPLCLRCSRPRLCPLLQSDRPVQPA